MKINRRNIELEIVVTESIAKILIYELIVKLVEINRSCKTV